MLENLGRNSDARSPHAPWPCGYRSPELPRARLLCGIPAAV